MPAIAAMCDRRDRHDRHGRHGKYATVRHGTTDTA
jgi:hypothetical protein